jgi:hypothetical protein
MLVVVFWASIKGSRVLPGNHAQLNLGDIPAMSFRQLSFLRDGKTRALELAQTWVAPNFGPASPEATRGNDFGIWARNSAARRRCSNKSAWHSQNVPTVISATTTYSSDVWNIDMEPVRTRFHGDIPLMSPLSYPLGIRRFRAAAAPARAYCF